MRISPKFIAPVFAVILPFCLHVRGAEPSVPFYPDGISAILDEARIENCLLKIPPESQSVLRSYMRENWKGAIENIPKLLPREAAITALSLAGDDIPPEELPSYFWWLVEIRQEHWINDENFIKGIGSSPVLTAFIETHQEDPNVRKLIEELENSCWRLDLSYDPRSPGNIPHGEVKGWLASEMEEREIRPGRRPGGRNDGSPRNADGTETDDSGGRGVPAIGLGSFIVSSALAWFVWRRLK